MHIVVVSVNHKTADVSLREKLTFSESSIQQALSALINQKSILEGVILSTCNRTEIYAVTDQVHTGRYYVKSFMSEWFDVDIETIKSVTDVKVGNEAIHHLFKVITGLDSIVLGETQILGQIRDSFLLAQSEGTTGTVFNKLFKDAITLAKRAHAETDISSKAVSVSYAAVELSKKILGKLENKKILIVGAGEMAELALQNLVGSGATDITVINRTAEKAKSLADQYGGRQVSLQELQCALIESDIVISSTSSQEFIITKPMMQDIMKLRKNKSLVLIDIAVPRDIDPEVNDIDLIFNYDVDDLKGLVDANLAERERAAQVIYTMIDKQVISFVDWINMLGVVPVITALREKALRIQATTMDSIDRKMPNLSERDRKVISKHMKSIINQILKDPISQAKEVSGSENRAEELQFFQEIFNITNEVESIKNNEPEVRRSKNSFVFNPEQ
ncbi:glutamyl-tRNA reductase [Macrococcoides caseolyticum]|uniref:Glutamyl-tRNA reductase n=1 Tax=Macrococcoides caseolyticum TaxID=69966 RepID=A0A2N0VTH9_9STAP|nr:glutamyl-tRNA reductase [Macrococcus caseolyticus]ARQ04882.1 Glutamyl-tRNA reductase [Macrococcus caseolyticus]PKD98025.1 glutamyl-tRNA reductase [Macrococcus caseolyticus]PKE07721.1 glutamyl-tRNA reductase [Macrococcus caseolyticus]PKE13332.1 glutamyl-tRNA reductase [Macrococcus caseolyticus]PKE18056.1 glutamyl-tRNA reductase [Macrococcus caseolyticus]